jgi:hypothetical protein
MSGLTDKLQGLRITTGEVTNESIVWLMGLPCLPYLDLITPHTVLYLLIVMCS